MPARYGASDDALRIDAPNPLEAPAPLRTIGPVRAVTTPLSSTVPAPFAVGQDTGCANAALRVTGGIHATTVLGIGLCPPNVTPGNAWINNQLVVNADPTGTEPLRVGGSANFGSNGSLKFAGVKIIEQDATYHRIYRRDGIIGLTLGGAGDQANYYDNDSHFFRNAAGANQAAITAGAWRPASAGSLTLGTAALHWGRVHMGDDLNFYVAGALRGTFSMDALNQFTFYNNVGSIIARLTTTAFAPGVAGGLTFGTGALPWGAIFGASFGIAVAGDLLDNSSGSTFLKSRGAGTIDFESPGGSGRWRITNSGHFLAITDNIYDIGAAGATRPRTGYFATSLVAPSGIFATSVESPLFTRASTGTLTIDSPGASGVIRLTTNGAGRWDISAAGHLLAVTDNSFDIGASGANRPRHLYLAGNLVVGGTFNPASLQVDSGATVEKWLTATVVWDPGSVAAQSSTSTTVTVTGAVTGNLALVDNQFIGDTGGGLAVVTAKVTAADTVTIQLTNAGSIAFDGASHTFRVFVIQF